MPLQATASPRDHGVSDTAPALALYCVRPLACSHACRGDFRGGVASCLGSQGCAQLEADADACCVAQVSTTRCVGCRSGQGAVTKVLRDHGVVAWLTSEH